MRIVLAATGLALLLGGGSARAQQTLTNACTGLLQMSLGMDILDSTSGDFITVNTTQVPNVLDLAECECNSMDLFVRSYVTTALPINTQEAYEIWAGNGCDQSTNRNSSVPVCEQITGGALTTELTDFWTGSGVTPRQLIPVQALANPHTHTCANTTSSNSLFYILYQQSTNPDSVCQILLPVHTVPPAPPTITGAGSGDGAITVSWNPPPVGTNIPVANYQIICSEVSGNPPVATPVAALQSAYEGVLGWSTCVNGQIQRRYISTGGDSGGGTDGGVVTGVDMAAAASVPTTLQPANDPLDASVGDGGADGGAGVISADAVTAFNNLDQSFVCSALLPSTSTTIRITGLTNGTQYQFAVVGIDLYGNPAPSAVLGGTPQPVEDLYRRFRDQGGAPQGFCFIATAAYGSYESPYVQVLRDFRDRELATNAPGRAFIAWYYATSPPLAAFIREHASARYATQELLRPVIALAMLWMALAPWHKVLLFAFVLLFVLRRRFIRVAQRGRA